jgi:FAD binding domain of DNA photolyase
LTTGRPFERLKYNHEVKLYDPSGDYIRLWVPELEHLPEQLVIQPWKVSEEEEIEHNFRYGVDYPYRILLPRVKALKHRDEDDELLIAEMKKRGMSLKGVKNAKKNILDQKKPYSSLR